MKLTALIFGKEENRSNTNNRGQLRHVLGWILISLFIFGCNTLLGEPTAVPTATPEPPPVEPGHWESDGVYSVSFDVSVDGEIHNLILEHNDCEWAFREDFTINADGSFLVGDVDTDGRLEHNSLNGEFDTFTTVAGEISLIWRCGTSSSYTEFFLGFRDWSAEWISP